MAMVLAGETSEATLEPVAVHDNQTTVDLLENLAFIVFCYNSAIPE